MPEWLKGEKIYIDPSIGENSAYGLSQGDRVTPIFNEAGKIVGIARENTAGTNAAGELFTDFFPEGANTSPGSTLEDWMQTYEYGGSFEDATDTTSIKVLFGKGGNIEQILEITPNGEQQIVGELKLSDYNITEEVTRLVPTDVKGIVYDIVTNKVPVDLSEMDAQLLKLNEELIALMEKQGASQRELIGLQQKLLEVFAQVSGEEKRKIFIDTFKVA